MRDDMKTLKNSQGLSGTQKDSERFRKTPKDSEKLRNFISGAYTKYVLCSTRFEGFKLTDC